MLDVRLPLVEPFLALGDGRDKLVDLLGMRPDLGADPRLTGDAKHGTLMPERHTARRSTLPD
jgi:hypothetical protein